MSFGFLFLSNKRHGSGFGYAIARATVTVVIRNDHRESVRGSKVCSVERRVIWTASAVR